MGRETDEEYFARRAREERNKAENAADPIGYRLHTDFARHYENRLQTVDQDNAEQSGSEFSMQRESRS